jgi:predicted transcriptional regulator
VSLETIKAYLFDDQLGMLAIAADCESPFISVDEEDSLALALERMAQFRYQQLPVRSTNAKSADLDGGLDCLVGLIAHDDLLQAYSRELSKRRMGLQEDDSSGLASKRLGDV